VAMGARVNETPLREPEESIVDGLEADIVVPCSRKPRSVAAVALPFGRVPGIAPLSMDVNDAYTMMCGSKQRLFRRVPKADPAWLLKLKAFVKQWLDANVRPVEPMDFEMWLLSTGYNEHRKQQLREAFDKLQGGRPTLKQCRTVEMHGKRESYPEYKHARSINSRSDAFKAYSGPMFKAIEEELYRHPYFVKHMTPEERMERVLGLRAEGSLCYATDFTAFESHFVPEVMDALELQLYNHCLVHYPEDAAIIARTLAGTNNMVTRFGLRAKCQGRRMSGDMCTSLGNGFSNLMLALFIANEKGAHLDGIVEGDDGLFVVDKELSDADWLKLGFTIKISRVANPCAASFCGLIFGPDRQVIRDPVRFLENFGWSESYITGSERVHMELLRAKSLSALHETPDCPIFGVIARQAHSITMGYAARFTDRWRALHTPEWAEKPFAPTLATRVLFQDMYGVSVEQQLVIEDKILRGDMNFSDMLRVHNHIQDYESRYVEHVSISSHLSLAQQMKPIVAKYEQPSG